MTRQKVISKKREGTISKETKEETKQQPSKIPRYTRKMKTVENKVQQEKTTKMKTKQKKKQQEEIKQEAKISTQPESKEEILRETNPQEEKKVMPEPQPLSNQVVQKWKRQTQHLHGLLKYQLKQEAPRLPEIEAGEIEVMEYQLKVNCEAFQIATTTDLSQDSEIQY